MEFIHKEIFNQNCNHSCQWWVFVPLKVRILEWFILSFNSVVGIEVYKQSFFSVRPNPSLWIYSVNCLDNFVAQLTLTLTFTFAKAGQIQTKHKLWSFSELRWRLSKENWTLIHYYNNIYTEFLSRQKQNTSLNELTKLAN